MALYETSAQVTSTNTTRIDLANAHFVTPINSDGKALVIKTRAEGIEGVLPVSKGGTGINELEGGKIIASNENGIFFEEVDVPVSIFKGIKGNIQNQIDSVRSYLVTIRKDNWVSISTGGFKQTITVNGIGDDDNPIVGIKTTGTDSETIANEKYAFSCLDRLETTPNTIALYCYNEKPGIDFTILLSCV